MRKPLCSHRRPESFLLRGLLHLIGRIPPWAALLVGVLWPAGWLLFPILYARANGFGIYWVLSVDLLLATILVVVAPPTLFIVAWRAVRRRTGGRAA